jgi:hypothetical protein
MGEKETITDDAKKSASNTSQKSENWSEIMPLEKRSESIDISRRFLPATTSPGRMLFMDICQN